MLKTELGLINQLLEAGFVQEPAGGNPRPVIFKDALKGGPDMSDCTLEMHNITKTFPGVKALKNVDFSCRKEEVHALTGENGAGKSTLMKILAGAFNPDSGEIIINGSKVSINNPQEAIRLGVAVIYQETQGGSNEMAGFTWRRHYRRLRQACLYSEYSPAADG